MSNPVILSEAKGPVILSEAKERVILSEAKERVILSEAKDLLLLGFEMVARLTDIPPSGLLSVRKADGTRVCLIRLGDQVRGIADNCTHREFALSEGELHGDGTVECAWHGAKFDSASGEATQGPAIKPVGRYAVRVTEGEIHVGGKLS